MSEDGKRDREIALDVAVRLITNGNLPVTSPIDAIEMADEFRAYIAGETKDPA